MKKLNLNNRSPVFDPLILSLINILSYLRSIKLLIIVILIAKLSINCSFFDCCYIITITLNFHLEVFLYALKPILTRFLFDQ